MPFFGFPGFGFGFPGFGFGFPGFGFGFPGFGAPLAFTEGFLLGGLLF